MTVRGYIVLVCNSGHPSLLPSAGWEMSRGQGVVAVVLDGKVTVGLASHRPGVIDSVVNLPIRDHWPQKLRRAPRLRSCSSMAIWLLLATASLVKLACIYVVDDVIERRHIDIRDVDLGWHVNAADVTQRQHGGQAVGRGAEYQPMSRYPSCSGCQHDVTKLRQQQIK